MNGFHHYINNLDGHSSRIIVQQLLRKIYNGTSLLFLVQTAIIGYIITFLLEIVESMGNLYKNVHFIIFHTGNLIGWSIIYRFWYFFLSRIQKIHDLFPKKASKQQWTLNVFGGRVFTLIVLYKMRGVLFKMCEIHRHMGIWSILVGSYLSVLFI